MIRRALLLAGLVLLGATSARAQERPELRVTRATQAPKIDGILDDMAWNDPPLSFGEWLS